MTTHPGNDRRAVVRWCRADDVLWRVGADRVLVRVVGGDAVDLVGAAALVWAVLDEPGTLAEIHDRLGESSGNLSGDSSVGAVLDMMSSWKLIRPDHRSDGQR